MTFASRCLFLFGLLLCTQHLHARDYYTVQQIAQAKAEARAKHLPIAWMSSPIVYLDARYANDKPGTAAELTALALRALQGGAVVILQDVDHDLPSIPANIAVRIEVKDEGDGLPNGNHYTAPKILYYDPDLQTCLGCTLAPQLRSDREAAITSALSHIRNDAQAQALIQGNGVTETPPAAAPTTATSSSPTMLPTLVSAALSGRLFGIVIGGLLLVLGLIAVVAMRQRT